MNMDSEAPEIEVDGNQTPPDQFEITLTTNRSKDQNQEESKVEEDIQYQIQHRDPDDPRTSQMGLTSKLPENFEAMGIPVTGSATKLNGGNTNDENQEDDDGVVNIEQIIIENATNEEDIRRATLKSKKEQEILEKQNSNRGKDGKQIYAQEYYALPWFRKPCIMRLCNFWRGVGATMMLFNHIIDVLYMMKQEFFNHKFSNLILTTMVLRAVFIFIYTVCQIYKRVIKFNPNLFDEQQQRDKQSGKQITEEERSIADKLAKRYGWMLYSGLGFNMYTGFYRVLDHKDFPAYIGLCLGQDIFFCLLPLFFLEVMNNSNFPVEWGLTPLQSACAIMKALCAFEIICEVLFFIYELLKFRYMKKAGLSKVDDYSKLPEQRKRYTWGKKVLFVGLISTAIFGLCITIGSATLNDRKCDDLQSLVGPVCEDCRITNCASCETSGPDSCDYCVPGYVYDPELNQCIDCDDDSQYNVCLSCTTDDIKNTPKTCQECATRYRLDANGVCMPCSDTHCDNCNMNSGFCLQCKKGYYSTPDGGCAKCSDSILYCNECTSGDKCDVCEENVTDLTPDGKCQCSSEKNYFAKFPDEENSVCECGAGYVLDDNRCVSCGTIINDCQFCEEHSITSPEYVYIGTHLTLAPEQKPYLSCSRCLRGENQFYDPVAHVCSSCKDHSDGCILCNQDGTKCTNCATGYYLDSISNCVPCWSYSAACQSCNSRECLRCKAGYFDWFGDCKKNPFY